MVIGFYSDKAKSRPAQWARTSRCKTKRQAELVVQAVGIGSEKTR